MLNGVDPDLLNFCAPWLAREPRLLWACQFAPAGALRERFLATTVLMRELAQATIAVSDRRVAEAKLSWWADEAVLWQHGQSRHPLALGLDSAACAADVARLVAHCTQWLSGPQAESFAAVWAQMQELAVATAPIAGSVEARAWTLPWLTLALRLSIGASAPLAGVVPLELFARHGIRRSQWGELNAAHRAPVLFDLAALVPPVTASARAELAALVVLERRWLGQSTRHAAADRLGVVDVLLAWQAGRRQRIA